MFAVFDVNLQPRGGDVTGKEIIYKWSGKVMKECKGREGKGGKGWQRQQRRWDRWCWRPKDKSRG